MKRILKLLGWAASVFAVAAANAGYEQPAYIDGCQSMDGRYVITAEQTVRGKTVHGPHQWEFIRQDTKTGETKRFPAHGIQGGQIYAQLFIAPDGETFALWNHITQFWPEKPHMRSQDVLPKRQDMGEEKYRALDIHKKRLIIYRKDGSKHPTASPFIAIATSASRRAARSKSSTPTAVAAAKSKSPKAAARTSASAANATRRSTSPHGTRCTR